jgi:acyl-coenzyme A synthetase/AMP-(fatty) acid ligase
MAWRQGKPVTAREFFSDAIRAARALPEGTHAINICTDRYLFMVGFAAALLRGQISLLPPSRVTGVIVAIAAEYDNCYLLADSHVGDGALPTFCLALSDERADVTFEVPQIELDRIAAIVFTSGSTGHAVANVKHWRTLVEGARLNAETLLARYANGVSLIATVPQQHMYGFEDTVMLPLMGHCAIHCGRPFYPQDVDQALNEVPMPRVLVTTPIHLRALVASEHVMPAATEIWSATAPLSVELAARSEALFQAPLQEIFGCSEAGSFATRWTSRGEAWRLYDAFQMTPSDEGAELRADHLPQVVSLQDSVEMLDPQHFRVLGRASDLVNIAGKRASLGDLNTRLLAIPGVRDGVIFMPDAPTDGAAVRTAAMVVAPGMTRAAIMLALRELIDPAFLPRRLLMVDALPRNETSKLPRAAVLLHFAEHARAINAGADVSSDD